MNTHPSSVEIDQIMAAVDRDWGFARLPQLVPNDLAQKFARQVQKYQQAVEDDDEAAIELHAGGLRRGVAALEAAARAAGHMPRHEHPPEPERPAHWIVPLSGQAYIRVVKTHDEARLLGADGGEPVLTAVEVGVLIEASQGWSTIREAKRHWPTAALRLGAKADPNWDVGDDISHLTQEAAQ